MARHGWKFGDDKVFCSWCGVGITRINQHRQCEKAPALIPADRRNVRISFDKATVNDVLDDVYMALFVNECALKFVDGQCVVTHLDDPRIITTVPHVLDGKRGADVDRRAKVIEEIQSIVTQHGYSLRRGNHYGRPCLVLCDAGGSPVVEISQIIPELGQLDPSRGIVMRRVSGPQKVVS